MEEISSETHLQDTIPSVEVRGSSAETSTLAVGTLISSSLNDDAQVAAEDDVSSGNDSQVEAGDGETDSAPTQTPSVTADENSYEDDGSLDVVVTGVEIDHAQSGASVVGAALLLGLHPYVVELVVSRARGSYCIRRDLTAFLNAITSSISGLTLPTDDGVALKCPEFPPKQSRGDAALAQWCADVTAFLADHISELHASAEWVKLVADSSVASAQNRALMTAIEFILQPFPYEKIYVPRGSSHEVVLPVKKEDQFLVWRFEVEDRDIDLTVHYLPTPSRQNGRWPAPSVDGEVVLQVIHPTTRFVATPGERPIEGMYECTGPGTATLVWDNSYSRLRGKNIRYQAQVVHKTIMESAVAAADAYDEAIQAKIQREELIRSSKKNQFDMQQLVVSPRTAPIEAQLSSSGSSYLYDTSAHLYRQLFADKLPTQSWLVSAPINVAGKLASRLFGSPQVDEASETKDEADATSGELETPDEALRSQTDGREAKSLVEELNGLNMQLLERLESCEDQIARLTVERDQERSRAHLTAVEKENLNASLAAKDLDLQAVKTDLQRIERERGAWREIQQERDALLEEKHRWAMTDDFETDEEGKTGRNDLDSETKNRLEQDLGRAEAGVLRLRAELGYSLNNHLTGTSTRLEKIAREMTATKKQYEDQMRASEQEVVDLKQQLVKYRSQKRVLVAEIKNMQAQSGSQVAVAMAEANEARMVNKRLKKQNELLLTQIRSLVDDARDHEKKVHEQMEQKRLNAEHENDQEEKEEETQSNETEPSTPVQLRPVETGGKQEAGADAGGVADSATVPYTLSTDDIALLNGERSATPPRPSYETYQAAKLPSQERAAEQYAVSQAAAPPINAVGNAHRERLVAFFQQKDPSMLPEVDAMLTSYAGVESMLFESLELKYNFMELNGITGDE